MSGAPLWTSDAIAAAVGGVASSAFEADGVTFDSREVGGGDLFIALKGETTDGHRFVDGALARAAAGVIVSQPVDGPHVRVDDTMAALTALARAARARTRATIVGVTGSAGKTGTKEALAAAFSRPPGRRVHRSLKSYNNHTGVPLSLARMPADSDVAVLEMGMNHAGEIAALTRLVRPHIAVITTIAPAHIEHFGDEEGIADAKAEIFEGLEAGGTAILPFDNRHFARLADKARAAGARVVSFGLNEGADVTARNVVEDGGQTMLTVVLGQRTVSLKLAQAGAHWVQNALAVMACVDAAGGDLAQAALALADMPGLAGRGARHRIRAGGGEALLIDESYNANPASMEATLAVLGATPAKRRVAVLGEMRELGERGAALHAGLAGPVIDAGVALAVLVGKGMQPLASALEGRCEVCHVPDAAAARDLLTRLASMDDAILVKGSNAVGLSSVVDALRSA